MNPIDRFKGKHTDDYLYFASDFSEIRMRQWLSVWMQASPSICREDVHSVLEFGGGEMSPGQLFANLELNIFQLICLHGSFLTMYHQY